MIVSMARYQTMENGKIRVFVNVKGKRTSRVFSKKTSAKSWAAETEVSLGKELANIDGNRKLSDVFDRYAREVSIDKKGAQWEIVRLTMFKRFSIANKALKKLMREDFEYWIKERLCDVKGSTVNRELNLMSHCLTEARRWRWIEHRPMTDLRRPPNPKHRERRVSARDIEKLNFAMGYSDEAEVIHKSQIVAVAFMLCIETGMRAGEVLSLTPATVNLESQYVILEDTKNGDSREVPLLTDRSIDLLNKLPKPEHDNSPFLPMSSASLSSLFRKYRMQTDIEDLVFHDSRHEATTRLASLPGMTVLKLAKIIGHRNLNQLLTYFNETAKEMVSAQQGANQESEKEKVMLDILVHLKNEIKSLKENKSAA